MVTVFNIGIFVYTRIVHFMKKILLSASALTLVTASLAFANPPSGDTFTLGSSNTMTIGSGSESITGTEGGSPTQSTYAISGNGGIGETSFQAASDGLEGSSTSTSFNLGGGLASAGAAFSESGQSYGQTSDTFVLNTTVDATIPTIQMSGTHF